MLILILTDFQYSQKAVCSLKKGSNHENHSSLGSFHPIKKFQPSKISDSHLTEGKFHPTSYHYLENSDPIPSFQSN